MPASFLPELFQPLPVLHVQGFQVHFIDFRHAFHQLNDFFIVAGGAGRIPVIGHLRQRRGLGSFLWSLELFSSRKAARAHMATMPNRPP